VRHTTTTTTVCDLNFGNGEIFSFFDRSLQFQVQLADNGNLVLIKTELNTATQEFNLVKQRDATPRNERYDSHILQI
jgi:hypothetical protein